MNSAQINEKAKALQIELANILLAEMSRNITEEDRKACESSIKISMPSIKRYMIGQGRNLDTAMKLVKFFKKRISERDKILGE